jgi:hypothetical protein
VSPGAEPTAPHPATCPYCGAAMATVVLGWHCLACHASLGPKGVIKKP